MFANSEPSSIYQANTDAYLNQEGPYRYVCNDYQGTGVNIGAVKNSFQVDVQARPVFLVINAVANSPSHAQYQLLVNTNRLGETIFDEEMLLWRAAIDSVQAPPPVAVLSQPTMLGDGKFQLKLAVTGSTRFTFRLEGSHNFSGWTTLITNIPSSSAGVVLQDTNAPLHLFRFYRAVRE